MTIHRTGKLEWADAALAVPPSEFVPTCKQVIPGKPMLPVCTCPTEPLMVEGVAYDRISPSCLIHGSRQVIPLREAIYDSPDDLIDWGEKERKSKSRIAEYQARKRREAAFSEV